MFRIKICGVRQVEEVEAVIAAGGDAVGLNFVPASPRCVTPAQAARLCDAAESIDRVGVFVNAAVDEIAHTAETAPLSHIQLHGEESDRLLQALPPQQVIRAWRVRGSQMEQVEQWLQQNVRQGWRPAALLLDAYAPNAHGGTGLTLDWQAIELEQGSLLGVPVILAGGLTPDNVAEAIRLTRPHGVDVASGVERAPGEKDLRRVRAFIREARAAFEEIAAAGR